MNTENPPAVPANLTRSNPTGNGHARRTAPIRVNFTPREHAALQSESSRLYLTPEELIVRAVAEWLAHREDDEAAPAHRVQQPLAPNARAGRLALRYVGALSQIPLTEETWAVIAMHTLYCHREQIVHDVALQFDAEGIHDASRFVEALLIIEQLLDRAGVPTDLEPFKSASPLRDRRSWLEVAHAALDSSEVEAGNLWHHDLLEKVNRQFRPWLKPAKAAAPAK